MTVSIKLRFTELQDFLDELEARRPNVDEIVRCCILVKPSSTVGYLSVAKLVASTTRYVSGQAVDYFQLVELEQPLGEVVTATIAAANDLNASLNQRREALVSQLEAFCRDQGLTLAHGRLSLEVPA